MRDGKTKNYLENAREILKKAGVDRRREAVYLSALEAIKALLILHLNLDEDFIQYIGELKIGKDMDYFQGLLKNAYDILHPIDAGFEAVEKIIKFVESYLYA
jgi:hypothetical protein